MVWLFMGSWWWSQHRCRKRSEVTFTFSRDFFTVSRPLVFEIQNSCVWHRKSWLKNLKIGCARTIQRVKRTNFFVSANKKQLRSKSHKKPKMKRYKIPWKTADSSNVQYFMRPKSSLQQKKYIEDKINDIKNSNINQQQKYGRSLWN